MMGEWRMKTWEGRRWNRYYSSCVSCINNRLEECKKMHTSLTVTGHSTWGELHKTTLPSKKSTFLFFEWLCQKLTDFSNFWHVKSWENLTRASYRFVYLKWQSYSKSKKLDVFGTHCRVLNTCTLMACSRWSPVRGLQLSSVQFSSCAVNEAEDRLLDTGERARAVRLPRAGSSQGRRALCRDDDRVPCLASAAVRPRPDDRRMWTSLLRTRPGSKRKMQNRSLNRSDR